MHRELPTSAESGGHAKKSVGMIPRVSTVGSNPAVFLINIAVYIQVTMSVPAFDLSPVVHMKRMLRHGNAKH